MSGKIIPISIYGDPVLRKTAQDIDNINGGLVELLNSTVLTMKAGKGLGLAANQVGIAKRFFAVDMSYFDVVKEPIVIINPEIVEVSGNVMGEEGCLSFPGLYFELERPEKAIITGLDINGRQVTYETRDLMARVMVHEIDHLNGRLFIDHLSKLKRNLINGKLKKIKAGEKI